MSRLTYRPEIDGLRALAVLPVVLFHTRLGFSGGYVGVDVFFVISGFLITALILADLQAGTFSLARFWERRIRRIAPAATVTVIVTLLVGYFLLLPPDFAELGESAVAQALLAANFYFYSTSGYFSAPSDSKPLLHFWSLAVEEQFYLIFPFLLLWFRRLRRIGLIALVVTLAIGSFALSVHGVSRYPDATFYLLPARAWELALGALLALTGCRLPLPERLKGPIGWIGLALIIGPMVIYTSHTPFPGAAALPPVLGTVLIIWATHGRESWLKSILSFRPIVFVGLLSYSLYLWHWPVQVYSHYWLVSGSPFVVRVAVAVASFALAWLSWRYIETPFRERRVFVPRRALLWGMGTATAAVMVMGSGATLMQGLPGRMPSEVLSYVAAWDERPQIEEADVSTEQVDTDALTRLTADLSPGDAVLLWGDSHARVVSPAIEGLCELNELNGFRASRSMTPSVLGWGDEAMQQHNAAVLRWIERHRPSLVILASRWDATLFDEQDEDLLRATIAAVEERGAKVWLMRQVPFQAINVPRALARAVLLGRDPSAIGTTVEEHQEMTAQSNGIIDRVASVAPNLVVLDPIPYLSRDGHCIAEESGEALYYDRQHLTVLGARLLEPMFAAAFNLLRTGLSEAKTDLPFALASGPRLTQGEPRPNKTDSAAKTPPPADAPPEPQRAKGYY
jgi:peptidoglycan/LPS O-acetylase OafA/YrhL